MHEAICIPQLDEEATMKKYIFVILLFGICSTTAHALCPVGVPGPEDVCGNPEFDNGCCQASRPLLETDRYLGQQA